MNTKATRKALNSAFKEFQRLPDWATLEPSFTKPRSQEGGVGNLPVIQPPGLRDDTSDSQTLAE
jgi:hypothetical protein